MYLLRVDLIGSFERPRPLPRYIERRRRTPRVSHAQSLDFSGTTEVGFSPLPSESGISNRPARSEFTNDGKYLSIDEPMGAQPTTPVEEKKYPYGLALAWSESDDGRILRAKLVAVARNEEQQRFQGRVLLNALLPDGAAGDPEDEIDSPQLSIRPVTDVDSVRGLISLAEINAILETPLVQYVPALKAQIEEFQRQFDAKENQQ